MLPSRSLLRILSLLRAENTDRARCIAKTVIHLRSADNRAVLDRHADAQVIDAEALAVRPVFPYPGRSVTIKTIL